MAKPKKPEPKFEVIAIKAKCSDPKVGQLLWRYIMYELTPEDEHAFIEHKVVCRYCGPTVHNWRSIVRALRFYGLPKPPKATTKRRLP